MDQTFVKVSVVQFHNAQMQDFVNVKVFYQVQ